MEAELTIKDRKYSFVRTRQAIPVSVYRGENSYLRIGPKELISKEIRYHKDLIRFGFPVGQILEEGEHEGLAYFIETSLGEEHFGQIFKSHLGEDKIVRDEDFIRLFDLVKEYAEAQMKSVCTQKFDREHFEHMIHFDNIIVEFPELKEKSTEVMRKIEERIGTLPLVLTHGDFNPHNILERGVIDWERVSLAPIGYDLVVAISQTYLFPHRGDFEFIGGYGYSKKQIEGYWKMLDELYVKNGLPKLSDCKNEFIVCRNMWSLARMGEFPKLQKWRRRQYEGILNAYEKGEDSMEYLLEHSGLYGI